MVVLLEVVLMAFTSFNSNTPRMLTKSRLTPPRGAKVCPSIDRSPLKDVKGRFVGIAVLWGYCEW